ncbi:hypothetical protein NCCNTM_09040 [Mycolicibacterium sp. NCC-Tsukiji]|nr:hypothetical protein NCCNTM_09040 [Mycolicibacterium sp. NCC-Tsukiji]
MVTETVRGHVAGRRPALLAGADPVDDSAGDESADHLGDPVQGERFPLDPAGQRRAERDRRIEMTAGDGAERVDARQYREAESDCDTEESDADRGVFGGVGGKDRGAATAEDQSEGADGLRRQPVCHRGSTHLVKPSNSSRKSRVSKQHFERPTDRSRSRRSLLNSRPKVTGGCPVSGPRI